MDEVKNRSEIESLFQKLFQPDFDILLLDLHLTKQETEVKTSSMDGIKVLNSDMFQYGEIPVIIFSASVRDLTSVIADKYKIQSRFYKGISTLSDFKAILSDIEAGDNKVIRRLIEIINQTDLFEDYYQCICEISAKDVIDSIYKKMTPVMCSDIKSRLENIRYKLRMNLYDDSDKVSKKRYEDIIREIGIIQECRLKHVRKVNGKPFWSEEVTRSSKIERWEIDLKQSRDQISHYKINSWRRTPQIINLNLIAKLVTSTCKSLLVNFPISD